VTSTDTDTDAGAGGSLASLRELNRLRIVDALRRSGSASRSELVKLTGLSRTTVTSLVSELQDTGLVVELADGDGGKAVQAGRGRPPVLLRLDPSAGAVVGIDFGHTHLRVAVADLSSTVLAERSTEFDVDLEAGPALDTAVQMIAEVLADAGLTHDHVVGVGAGMPGPIDRRTGTVGSSVILPGWQGLNPAAELTRRLQMPVEVDNDANLGALAEHVFGAGRGTSALVYVKISSGIGSGLVLGGRLYHGATGVAGELGHVQVQPDGALCRCGNRGCLETVASSGPLLALLRPVHGEELTSAGLLELLAAGDIGARRVVNDAGRAVGRVVADLCNHLNPGVVVVGGELSGAGAPLFDGIRESVDRHALPGAAAAVRILPAELGDRAEMLGALALVIGNTDRLRSAGLAPLAATGQVAG
jgi:predicted NBD/HSP70 family sugar kinase/biotin operon repressor